MDDMVCHAVMVRVEGPDPKGLKRKDQSFSLFEFGTTTLSASGLITQLGGEHVVVTTAHIIRPFLVDKSRPNAWRALTGSATTPPGSKPGDKELVEGTRLEVMMSPASVSEGHSWLPASVLALGGIQTVATAVRELLNPWDGWTIGGQKVGYGRTNGQEPEPGEVAVLALGADAAAAVSARVASAAPLRVRQQPLDLRLGEPVGMLASPFGALSPSIFLNSVSTGVVSNYVKLGPEKSSAGEADADNKVALILTDARCLPCSEGAPVVDEAGLLLGLVLPELQQRNGQVVGYSLVAPFECLQPFLSTCAGLLSTGAQSGAGGVRMVPAAASADHGESHDLITLAPPHTVLPIPRSAGLFGKGAVDKAGKSLAMVCVGTSWASGILVSERGHILTNAHVFHTGSNKTAQYGTDYPKTSVWIKLARPNDTDADLSDASPVECEATVIYKSDGPLDVALLQAKLPAKPWNSRATSGTGWQCRPVDLDECFTACSALTRGESVAAYGHALFGTHWRQRRPCFSVGNLSKVIYLDEKPAMLQSSAAVHGGNSGGMMINKDGVVLGMVTSNVRHTPPPLTGEDEAAAKKKAKATEEGGTLLVELNFSMPLPVLEELLQLAGIVSRTNMDDPIDHTLLDEKDRQRMDTPDADLAALWALNLEQEQAYQQRVDAAPGGPRFQKFMDEYQTEQQAAPESAGASARSQRIERPMLLMRHKI